MLPSSISVATPAGSTACTGRLVHEFGLQTLTEQQAIGLASAVGRGYRKGIERHDRTDIDDRTAVAGDKARQRRTGQMGQRSDVNGDHRVDNLPRQVRGTAEG